MLESEPHIVPVECSRLQPAHFRAAERVGARKCRSRRCAKLPASACLDVPEFENCIHKGACIRPCASRALLAGGAVSQRVCWKD